MFAAVKHAARNLYRRNPVLMTFAVLALLGLPGMAIAYCFDTRLITGLNPWVKPLKFTSAFALYFVTFGWLLSYLPRPSRAVSIISWVSALCVLLEGPAMVLQSARGETSFYNTGTLFDGFLYGMMSAGALIQAGMLAWALGLFCTRSIELPKLPLYGIRAGLALWLLGILPALVMLALRQHGVGVADGGPGLPLLNFSTLGGDLRIAHFLGLHAIQLLPLAGVALQRLQGVISLRSGLIAFTLLAAVYTLAMIATFAQAMAGLPLIALN
jgi:hypothetical protein